jgi:CheY-specific phosphatase CheX
MKSISNDELAILAAGTFADTAFLLAEPADDQAPWTSDWVSAVIPFEAEQSGRLVVAAPMPLCTQLATDMMCLEPGDPEATAQGPSAVAELANVLAGVLLARLFEDSGKWQLGLPRLTTLEPGVAPGEHSNRVTLLNEMGHPIRVEVVLATAA